MSSSSTESAPTLLCIDKPVGMTSFDVIRVLRRTLGVRKMGHAGTLDPLASGLLLVGVGAGTKQLHELVGLDKEYVATVRIGERRSTGDLEGEVVEARAVVALEPSAIAAALASMVGVLTLPVSAYSAVKRNGAPLYKRARKAEKTGEQLGVLAVREMRVVAAELLGVNQQEERVEATVRFMVGSGTYVRSLAEELGRRLGYPATLAALRRTRVGEFDINNALRLDEI